MGLDVSEIGMGSDLSLDLRYFASNAVRQVRDAPAVAEARQGKELAGG
jgi:hypothetical protein